ncbi:MAG: hypothetical protein ACXACD_04130 [Candidatus Thorarchaeota archaeon]|jgi:hypothetical protein
MALTTIASPSKSENLIYTILPLSLGLWILALISMITLQDQGILQFLPDLTQSLALVAVFVSILSIALYEIGLDEYFVKSIYRRRAGSRSLFQRYSFLLWRWILRTWESETVQAPYPRREPTGILSDFRRWLRIPSRPIDYIETQVDVAVQATISSPFLEKRLWRIRGSIYLFLAALFFFWSAAIAVSIVGILITDISTLIPALGPLSLFIPIALAFRDGWFLVLITFWGAQLVANWRRHMHLREHIQYSSQLHFARKSHAVLSVTTKGPPPFQAENELETLDESLWEGSWSRFVDSFTRVTERLRDDWIVDFVEKEGLFDLVRRWASLAYLYIESPHTPIQTRVVMQEEKEKLGWLVYYFAVLRELKHEYDKEAKHLVELPFPKYTEEEWAFIDWMRTFWNDSLPNLDKPDLMLIKLVEKLDAPKKSIRIIQALMIGLFKNRNYNADVAEEVGTLALLRGELRDGLPEPSLADEAFLKYFCGVKDANMKILESINIEEMTRLYSLGIALNDCWKDILLTYIEKADTDKLKDSKNSPFLKDFLADMDIEQALRERELGGGQ